MSQFSDRDLSKSDEQKRQEIALFRYGLISPVIHGAFEGSAIDYFRRITREPLEIPHIGPAASGRFDRQVLALPLPPRRARVPDAQDPL